MATRHETSKTAEQTPIVPRRTPDEQREQNARLIAALDRLAEDDDVEDQRETLAVLRAAGLVAPEGGPVKVGYTDNVESNDGEA